MSHEEIVEYAASGEAFREVPLGEGCVKFDDYYAALADIGYEVYLTINREKSAINRRPTFLTWYNLSGPIVSFPAFVL